MEVLVGVLLIDQAIGYRGNPDQVFEFITELMRPIGTHLFGRRLYETMAHWDGPAPNRQHLRSNPISSTNVTCFSIR